MVIVNNSLCIEKDANDGVDDQDHNNGGFDDHNDPGGGIGDHGGGGDGNDETL